MFSWDLGLHSSRTSSLSEFSSKAKTGDSLLLAVSATTLILSVCLMLDFKYHLCLLSVFVLTVHDDEWISTVFE